MDRGAWQATVLGITKSRAELSDFHFISLHFIDLLSILLRCNDFTGIQKAVVDQSRSGPTNSDHNFFFFLFGASLALGNALELLFSPATEPVVASCHIKFTFVAGHNLIEKWFIVVVHSKRR